MKIILISGTPGTGKSYLAKKLSKILDFRVLDVTNLIKENKLYDRYDPSKRCYVVNEKKLAKYLEKTLKQDNKNTIVDSHMSHFLSPELANICIITRCPLKTLEKRLKKRRYAKAKIKDNLEAEAFDTCYNEALELGHNVIVYENNLEDFLPGLLHNLGVKVCHCGRITCH